MENYEGNVRIEQITSDEARVYHENYFYFDYKGNSYRGLWFTVGYTYSGIRVWKKIRIKKWFIERDYWELVIEDVLKHGQNIIQDKRGHYSAIKTYNECVKALNTTKDFIPHTEKIVR